MVLVYVFRLFRQRPKTMIRLRVTVTLCLLCFLAASLVENSDQDAGSEREVREANDNFDTAAETYNDVLVRQKRNCECTATRLSASLPGVLYRARRS